VGIVGGKELLQGTVAWRFMGKTVKYYKVRIFFPVFKFFETMND